MSSEGVRKSQVTGHSQDENIVFALDNDVV